MDIIKINLFNSPLFENRLDIGIGDKTIDLHNNYLCNNIEINSEKLILIFRETYSQEKVYLQFENPIINRLSLPLANLEGLTLDNFHRGRYESEGKLYETYNNKNCFYIEFYEGGALEFLCSNALLNCNK